MGTKKQKAAVGKQIEKVKEFQMKLNSLQALCGDILTNWIFSRNWQKPVRESKTPAASCLTKKKSAK